MSDTLTFVQLWIITKKEFKNLEKLPEKINIPKFTRYLAFASVEGHREVLFYGCSFKDWKAMERVCNKVETMYPNEQMVYDIKQETKRMKKQHEKLHKKEEQNVKTEKSL